MRIIAGKYKGLRIQAPSSDLVRPTMDVLKESLFNICMNEIDEASFLDLFAGSGSIGIEAISRGASQVTFVDMLYESISTIRLNTQKLHITDQSTIIKMNADTAIIALHKKQAQFDIIFADPPYSFSKDGSLISLLSHISNTSILKQYGSLFIESDRTSTHPDMVGRLYKIKEKKIGNSILIKYKFKDQP